MIERTFNDTKLNNMYVKIFYFLDPWNGKTSRGARVFARSITMRPYTRKPQDFFVSMTISDGTQLA